MLRSMLPCCLVLCASTELARADDRALIQGNWQLVYSESEGKIAPVERTRDVRVEIKAGTHSVSIGDKQVAHDVTFTMDPKATPQTTGDTLISCVAKVGAERPGEFEAKAGTGHTLRVLKRVRSDETAKDKAIREELMRFGGGWHMSEFQVHGKTLPAEPADKFELILRGDRWWTKTPLGMTSGVFELDPTQKPKTIDLVFKTGPQPGKTLLRNL